MLFGSRIWTNLRKELFQAGGTASSKAWCRTMLAQMPEWASTIERKGEWVSMMWERQPVVKWRNRKILIFLKVSLGHGCVCVYVFSHRLLLYQCLEEFTEEKGFELEDKGKVSFGPILGALRRHSLTCLWIFSALCQHSLLSGSWMSGPFWKALGMLFEFTPWQGIQTITSYEVDHRCSESEGLEQLLLPCIGEQLRYTSHIPRLSFCSLWSNCNYGSWFGGMRCGTGSTLASRKIPKL